MLTNSVSRPFTCRSLIRDADSCKEHTDTPCVSQCKRIQLVDSKGANSASETRVQDAHLDGYVAVAGRPTRKGDHALTACASCHLVTTVQLVLAQEQLVRVVHVLKRIIERRAHYSAGHVLHCGELQAAS